MIFCRLILQKMIYKHMFLEFLVVSFFDINTFCIFSIIHWYPSIQKFVQPTGWMLVWRSSTWQFDLSTWLKDHGRRHWSCCFGREPTWGLAKILLTFALKILWNLKSSNQSMLMKFGTQVVAGEYIQRLCEVPQDTNQTTLWHQRFSKKNRWLYRPWKPCISSSRFILVVVLDRI